MHLFGFPLIPFPTYSHFLSTKGELGEQSYLKGTEKLSQGLSLAGFRGAEGARPQERGAGVSLRTARAGRWAQHVPLLPASTTGSQEAQQFQEQNGQV